MGFVSQQRARPMVNPPDHRALDAVREPERSGHAYILNNPGRRRSRHTAVHQPSKIPEPRSAVRPATTPRPRPSCGQSVNGLEVRSLTSTFGSALGGIRTPNLLIRRPPRAVHGVFVTHSGSRDLRSQALVVHTVFTNPPGRS